jgi:hypothetical protein
VPGVLGEALRIQSVMLFLEQLEVKDPAVEVGEVKDVEVEAGWVKAAVVGVVVAGDSKAGG